MEKNNIESLDNKIILAKEDLGNIIKSGEFESRYIFGTSKIELSGIGIIEKNKDGESVLSKELLSKFKNNSFGEKLTIKNSDGTYSLTENYYLFLDSLFSDFNIDVSDLKSYKTKKILDQIYSELRSLKLESSIEKKQEISSKIEELRKNTLEYSNLHQVEIKLLSDMLEDFNGITGKENDREGVIDFDYKFRTFKEKLKQKFEKINPEDINIVYLDGIKEENEILYMYRLISNVIKFNQNTEIIYLDFSYEGNKEVYYEILSKIEELEKKLNRDIKIILCGDEKYDTGVYSKYGLFFGDPLISVKESSEMNVDELSQTYSKIMKNKKGVIGEFITKDKDKLNIVDTINIIANPVNLLKYEYGKEKKISSENKEVFTKNFKGRNNMFYSKSPGDDFNGFNLRDTKILMIGKKGTANKLDKKDIFYDGKTKTYLSGIEIIANGVVDSELNNK